jgi:DNA repair protein RecO (recombination protein O)
MTSSPDSLCRAYVLHRQAFRNTSLLVDLFSPELGRIKAVARGARREKSRHRAPLQLFVPLLIGLRGRGDVKTLVQVEPQVGAINLQGTRLFSAMYLNELLCRLLHNHVEHPRLYRDYQDSLLALQGSEDVQTVLRRFELSLLAELGYGIDLYQDSRSGLALDAEREYRYVAGEGLVAAAAQQRVAPDTGQHQGYLGKHLIALREANLSDPEAARAAKKLLRHALAGHLGPKPLTSRSFFAKAQKTQP